jgi:hypothetical protein
MSTADRIVAIVIAAVSILLAEGFHYALTRHMATAEHPATNVRAEPFPSAARSIIIAFPSGGPLGSIVVK